MKMISTLALVATASFFSVGCQSNKSCSDAACAGDKAACCEGEKGACCAGEKAAACEGTKAAAAGATVNSMCVLNPTENVAAGVMTDYKGSKVGFCCPGCIGKFNAMSDADKTARLAKVGVTIK